MVWRGIELKNRPKEIRKREDNGVKNRVMRRIFALLACIGVMLMAGCNAEKNSVDVPNNSENNEFTEETAGSYTVSFVDYDGTVILETMVNRGDDAHLPESPARDGYLFAGWDGIYQSVMKDTTITARYVAVNAPDVVCVEHSNIENGTVTVTVRMMGEVRFCAFQTLLDYDENVLQFIEMTKYYGVEGRNADVNGDQVVSLAWANFDNVTQDLLEADGVLMEVVFAVLDPDCGRTAVCCLKDQTHMSTVQEDGSYVEVDCSLIDCILKMN